MSIIIRDCFGSMMFARPTFLKKMLDSKYQLPKEAENKLQSFKKQADVLGNCLYYLEYCCYSECTEDNQKALIQFSEKIHNIFYGIVFNSKDFDDVKKLFNEYTNTVKDVFEYCKNNYRISFPMIVMTYGEKAIEDFDQFILAISESLTEKKVA